MAIITVTDMNFSFGGPLLLEDINFQIGPAERVCLLGRNGCGKSTFLRLLQGKLHPDSGEIVRSPQLRTAMLDQSVPQRAGGKVFDVVAEGLGEIGKLLCEYHRLSHQSPDDHSSSTDMRLERLHNELDKADAWKKQTIIETTISQVGIDPEATFDQLSAGLKRRVLLARALAAEPDILMLDEPTNHLDIDSINWLEEFLLRWAKTLVFVTHDRMFLKKLSTRIIEIDRGRLSNWNCGYDDYLKRKEHLIATEQSHWEQFDKKLAEEERWIRKGIQARRTRNEGRVRQLQKMRKARQQRRRVDGRVKIEINAAGRSGDLVVRTRGADFAYCDDSGRMMPPIIRDLNTTIIRGDRIGIIGPNGAGKTTLLRLLLGEFAPTNGTIRIGTNVQYAYFDQLHGRLEEDKSLAENIGQGYDTITVNGREKHVVGYLRDFLFAPDMVPALVSSLSGGERNRLQIAKVFTQPSNVLVLDEPTNDLDVETLELLEEMLIDYSGTVLIVSHDRAFLNNVVTSTLVLEGEGRVKEYAGGYDDWLRQRGDRETAKEVKITAKAKKAKPQKAKPAKLSYRQKQELEGLPDLIETLEKEIASLHEKMAEPSFYRQDGATIAGTKAILDEHQSRLQAAYSRWEELAALE